MHLLTKIYYELVRYKLMYPYARMFGWRYLWDREFRIKNYNRRKKHRRKVNGARSRSTQRKRNVKKKLIARDGPMCQWCFTPLRSDATIDHIKKLSEGGTESDENMQLLHIKCHMKKDNETSGETEMGRAIREMLEKQKEKDTQKPRD